MNGTVTLRNVNVFLITWVLYLLIGDEIQFVLFVRVLVLITTIMVFVNVVRVLPLTMVSANVMRASFQNLITNIAMTVLIHILMIQRYVSGCPNETAIFKTRNCFHFYLKLIFIFSILVKRMKVQLFWKILTMSFHRPILTE